MRATIRDVRLHSPRRKRAILSPNCVVVIKRKFVQQPIKIKKLNRFELAEFSGDKMTSELSWLDFQQKWCIRTRTSIVHLTATDQGLVFLIRV